MDPEVAARIRLVVLDADGVLTDGGIYVADGVGGRPFQLRRFSVQDGMAIHLLREAGVESAIVSGRDSPAVRERARELGIREVHQVKPWEKIPVVVEMLGDRGLGWENLACLADDLADVAVMQRAALPGAVANAVPEVVSAAVWQGNVPGGHGAVREFVETLLKARDQWDEVIAPYVESDAAAGAETAGEG